jgi:hypothetical protein
VLLYSFQSFGQTDSIWAEQVSYISRTNLGARDVHTDCEGNKIYVGGTSSSSFSITPGTISSSYHGGASDVFIVKIDSAGQSVWSTLFGGNLYDRAYAVEIDSQGYIYIAGRAGPGLPTTLCALQQSFAGDSNPNSAYGIQDGFIAKITPDGSSIVWATYIGCDGRGFIRDIDLDSDGNIWTGISNASPNFPHITSNAVQLTATATMNPALIKLSSDGSTLLYGTFLSDGQSTSAGPTTVRVDKNDNVYFLSHASTNNIPVTPNAFQPLVAGNIDFVISKFDTNGSLIFCSFLGGPAEEEVETHSLEVDTAGNVIVAAYSFGAGYPIVGNPIQSTFSGVTDGVITKISADGSTIIASTYLGGDSQDEVEGIGVDANNNIYVCGTTFSTDFPVNSNLAFEQVQQGQSDGYFAMLSPDLSTIKYATFIGGSNDDKLRGCHVDEWGKFHGCGSTASGNFPVFNEFNSNLTGSLTGCAVTFKPTNLFEVNQVCTISNSNENDCLPTKSSMHTGNEGIVLFPNPSEDFVTIKFNMNGKHSFSLYNSVGNLIQTYTESSPFKIELSGIPSGFYFLKIDNYPSKVIRFVKY